MSAAPRVPTGADYILAIVNQELVTAREVELRIQRLRDAAAAARPPERLPPPDELRSQVLESLIDERIQITHARESGQRVDDAELDRAVEGVAAQNQVTVAQLRDRLREQGLDYGRFRSNIRDQLLVERIRDREVQARIQVPDAEINALIEKQRAATGAAAQLNLAQVLVSVPEGASDAVVAERRARAESALSRIRAGEAFDAVVKDLSEDANKAKGGVLGLRSADRLPDLFVSTVRGLKDGEMAPELLRTGAGFHVLKLIERREGGALAVMQTRARHILLRLSPQLSSDAAARRLAEFKRQIVSGAKTFEQIARESSEDGSASQGGNLGWASPGGFVPEFEQAMNALPIDGLSEPVASRFGVHLIQVLERRQVALDVKQQREQARNILREQKFEAAYIDWLRDLRAQAYIEMREAPR